jgi:predicted nucleic acid-binding protein
MRVVDTSAWIEWLLDSATGRAFGLAQLERAHWLVPTIVQMELARWVRRELDEDKADVVIALSRKCVIIPLDSDIALAAAALWRAHKLATADAIVYATALAHRADILTCDPHFKDLPNVVYIEKRT